MDDINKSHLEEVIENINQQLNYVKSEILSLGSSSNTSQRSQSPGGSVVESSNHLSLPAHSHLPRPNGTNNVPSGSSGNTFTFQSSNGSKEKLSSRPSLPAHSHLPRPSGTNNAPSGSSGNTFPFQSSSGSKEKFSSHPSLLAHSHLPRPSGTNNAPSGSSGNTFPFQSSSGSKEKCSSHPSLLAHSHLPRPSATNNAPSESSGNTFPFQSSSGSKEKFSSHPSLLAHSHLPRPSATNNASSESSGNTFPFHNSNGSKNKLSNRPSLPAFSYLQGQSAWSNSFSAVSSGSVVNAVKKLSSMSKPRYSAKSKANDKFKKELILLKNCNRETTLSSTEKINHGSLVRLGVEFSKSMTQEDVCSRISEEYDPLLFATEYELLMPSGKQLCPPSLGKGATLDGNMLAFVFRQKPIYIRPFTNLWDSDESDTADEESPPKKTRKVVIDNDTQSSDSISLTQPSDNETIITDDIINFEDSDSVFSTLPDNITNLEDDTFNSEYSNVGVQENVTIIEGNGNHDVNVEGNRDQIVNGESSESVRSEDNVNAVVEIEDNLNPIGDVEIELPSQQFYPNYVSTQLSSFLLDVINPIKAFVIKGSNSRPFRVSREDPLMTAVDAMKLRGFSCKKTIYVQFVDDIGGYTVSENAIDANGPKIELFSLVLQQLHSRSPLFEGPDYEKLLTFNDNAYENRLYYYAGLLMSMSILQGGPSPQFFSRDLMNALCENYCEIDSKTIPDNAYLLALVNDIKANEGEETLRRLITSSPLDLGEVCSKITDYDNKDHVIQELVVFYKKDKIKGPLQQLAAGFEEMGLLQAIKTSLEFREALFLKSSFPTAAQIIELFAVVRSPAGSNRFSVESRVLLFWTTYLEDCEDEEDCEGEDGSTKPKVSLDKVLQFALGTSTVPAMGFSFRPKITFHHDHRNKVCPEALTCSLNLILPVCHLKRECFVNACNKAFLEPPVFMLA